MQHVLVTNPLSGVIASALSSFMVKAFPLVAIQLDMQHALITDTMSGLYVASILSCNLSGQAASFQATQPDADRNPPMGQLSTQLTAHPQAFLSLQNVLSMSLL